MAFRLFSRNQVFFDNLGQPLAGGSAEFFDTATTTPKNVYSDSALSVNLGSTETLDSAGRFATGIWGSGTYRVRFKNGNGVEVSDDDPIADPNDAALSIPSQTGHTGEFLTTNGTALSWYALLTSLLPDMTGSSGKVLSTDGTAALWKTLAELGLPEVAEETSGGSFVFGTFRVQFGHDTFPAPSVSPPHGAVKAVTFPVAFAATPVCYGAWGNKNSIATHDYKPVVSCEATGTTLTAQYNINENSTDPTADVAVAVPFSWFAIGLA